MAETLTFVGAVQRFTPSGQVCGLPVSDATERMLWAGIFAGAEAQRFTGLVTGPDLPGGQVAYRFTDGRVTDRWVLLAVVPPVEGPRCAGGDGVREGPCGNLADRADGLCHWCRARLTGSCPGCSWCREGGAAQIGIPYAEVDVDTGERICPVCGDRIAERYDATGEMLTNHYGDHYESQHPRRVPEGSDQ